METAKLGISNLKIVVVSVAAFGSTLGAVMADGKIDLFDTIHLVKIASEVGDLAKLDVKMVIPEVGNIDKEEIGELAILFDENFKLGEFPSLEAKIEAGLAATIKALEAIQFIIALVK